MAVSGWVNTLITTVLFLALLAVVVHYYRPRKKGDAERAEQPKYRMLEDEDEQ